MTRDSQYSYLHMNQPNYILFRETWENDRLPFDDIEVNLNNLSNTDNLLQQFLQSSEDNEPDLNVIGTSNSVLATNKSSKRNKKPNWTDLGLNEFLDPKSRVPDRSVLVNPESQSDVTINAWSNFDSSHLHSFDLSNQINTTNDDSDDDQDLNSQQLLIDESFMNRNQSVVAQMNTNNNSNDVMGSDRPSSNLFATPNVGYRSISNPQIFRHSSANSHTPQRNFR